MGGAPRRGDLRAMRQARGLIEIGDIGQGAFAGECCGTGATQAAGAARHQCDLARDAAGHGAAHFSERKPQRLAGRRRASAPNSAAPGTLQHASMTSPHGADVRICRFAVCCSATPTISAQTRPFHKPAEGIRSLNSGTRARHVPENTHRARVRFIPLRIRSAMRRRPPIQPSTIQFLIGPSPVPPIRMADTGKACLNRMDELHRDFGSLAGQVHAKPGWRSG